MTCSHGIIPAFELPTQNMTSAEDGRHVNIVSCSLSVPGNAQTNKKHTVHLHPLVSMATLKQGEGTRELYSSPTSFFHEKENKN